MAAKDWLAGVPAPADVAAEWSPTGVPQPGDTAVLTNGGGIEICGQGE